MSCCYFLFCFVLFVCLFVPTDLLLRGCPLLCALLIYPLLQGGVATRNVQLVEELNNLSLCSVGQQEERYPNLELILSCVHHV